MNSLIIRVSLIEIGADRSPAIEFRARRKNNGILRPIVENQPEVGKLDFVRIGDFDRRRC
jgi:hypothetical protein